MGKRKSFLVVLVNLILTFVLMGCSELNKVSTVKQKPKPKVEDSVTKYFEAIKNFDDEAMAEYSSTKPKDFDIDKDNNKDEIVIEFVLSKMEYVTESTSIDKDKATAKVRTKTVDFERVLPKFLKKSLVTGIKNLSEEKNLTKEQKEKQYFEIFKQIVEDNEKTMRESWIDVNLSLKDDKWVIDNSDDIIKRMFDTRIFDILNKK